MVKFNILLVAVVSVLVLESVSANVPLARGDLTRLPREVSHSNNEHEGKHHETSHEGHHDESEEDSKEEELSHEVEEEEENDKSLETYLKEFRGLLEELKDIVHDLKSTDEEDDEEVEEHKNGNVEMIEIKIPEYIPHETEKDSKTESKD